MLPRPVLQDTMSFSAGHGIHPDDSNEKFVCDILFTWNSFRMAQILEAIVEIANHLYVLDVVHEKPW